MTDVALLELLCREPCLTTAECEAAPMGDGCAHLTSTLSVPVCAAVELHKVGEKPQNLRPFPLSAALFRHASEFALYFDA